MPFGTPTDNGAAYSTAGGTTVAPLYPTGIAANDVVLLLIGQKPSTANGGTVTTPTGWTLRESITAQGGYGTGLTADTGNTNLFIYSKNTVAGTETGSLSVTVATNDVCWGVIVRIPTAGAGATFTYGSADGARITAPTSGTAFTTLLTNGATAPALQSGDMAVWAMCIPTDVLNAGFTLPTITSTGTTFATAVKLEEPDSGVGNDIGGYIAYSLATAGTSTAAPTVGITATGTVTNVRGPIALLRVRETLPARTGNLAATETGSDTFAATGTAPAARTGDLAATETGSDTFAATGTVAFQAITGDLAATETGSDVAALTGTVLVSGDFSGTETGSDSFAATGNVIVSGSLAATEVDSDSFAASGSVIVAGSLAATEAGQDTFSATGGPVVSGTLAASEAGEDVFAASGAVLVVGALSADESGSDALAATGVVLVSGTVSLQEAGEDAFAASGQVTSPGIVGSLSTIESGSDSASINGIVPSSGSMAATETGADSLAASGSVSIAGTASTSLVLNVSATADNTAYVTAIITLIKSVSSTTVVDVTGVGTESLLLGTASSGAVSLTANGTAGLVLGTTATGQVLGTGTGTAALAINVTSVVDVDLQATATASLSIGTASTTTVGISSTGTAVVVCGVTAIATKFGVVATASLDIGVTSSALISISVGISGYVTERARVSGPRIDRLVSIHGAQSRPLVHVAKGTHESQHVRVTMEPVRVLPRVFGSLTITPQ